MDKQASEFYVPNMINDRILLTSKGHPDIRRWSDLEFSNTKAGRESLGIDSSSLLSGDRWDHMGNEYPIPHTMVLTLMNTSDGTHHTVNVRRRQFLKPNTRSVR